MSFRRRSSSNNTSPSLTGGLWPDLGWRQSLHAHISPQGGLGVIRAKLAEEGYAKRHTTKELIKAAKEIAK